MRARASFSPADFCLHVEPITAVRCLPRSWALLPGLALCALAAGAQQATTKPVAPSLHPQAAPLSFVRNAGQDSAPAPYLAHGPGYSMRLFPDAAELTVTGGAKDRKRGAAKTEGMRLRMEFLGAETHATLETADPLPGVMSYFTGPDQSQWHSGLPTYAQLRYRGIYPGVDLSFHGSQSAVSDSRPGGGKVEYDFELQPHARLDRIAIALRGAEKAEIDRSGNLLLTVHGTPMRFLKPVAWQGGERRPVEAAYKLTRASGGRPATVRFRVAGYDPAQTLVVDPVLDYATYIDLYSENAMAVDTNGNVYVTGADPTNPDTAFDVLKFNTTGALSYTAIIQANTSGTYGYGFASGIAVDSTGHAYIAGGAGPGWPTTTTAYQQQNGYASASSPYYDYNAYLVKLNMAGTTVDYASYLGGGNSTSVYTDYAVAVTLDSSANAYIVGAAASPDFPTTTGAYQPQYPAGDPTYASFVAKFNLTLSGAKSLVYSTLLGDPDTYEEAIAIDASGDAYLTGYADNSYNTFPITPGAFAYNGLDSGQGGVYVTELNPAGSALVYSAYLGGGGYGNGIAVDGSGDAYITGWVNVEDFPTTSGAYQTSYPGGFVTELNPTGTAEIYSTFLSGPSGVQEPTYTVPVTIAITPGCASACAAYVAGTSYSGDDFPQINSIQTTPTGTINQGFVVGLNGTGTAATFSTYLSGLADETTGNQPSYVGNLPGSPSIAVDKSGNVYYAANINTADFPVTTTTAATVGASHPPYLAKIGAAAGGIVVAYPKTVSLGSTIVGTSSAVYNAGSLPTVTLRNMGTTAVTLTSITPSSSVFSQTNTCGGTIPAGGQCVLTPSFTPTVSGSISGTLSIASTGSGSPLTISVSGNSSDAGYLEVSATALNFGDQTVGTSSAFQTFIVTNSGDEPITSFYINFISSGFATLNNCPATLNAGASCQFGVQFAPYQAGYDNGYLALYNTSSGTTYVGVSGTGVITGDAGSLALSSTAVNFDTEAVGIASTSQYVTITNTGAMPVTVNPYTVALTSTGGSPADFAVTPNTCGAPPFAIQPQASCSFYVVFTPSAAATETAKLTVPNSSAASPTVALSGIGAADTQTLTFTPFNFVFPDQAVGTTSSTQATYVFNTGDYPISFDRVYASGDFRLTNDQCTGTISPPSGPGLGNGGYCVVYLSFTPTAVGSRTGSVTFVDSATGIPQTLSLSGNGIATTGSLVIDPPTYTFPAQAVGTTSYSATITVTNPGNSPVTVNSLSITGDYSFPAPYISNTSSNCGYTLPCSIPVGGSFTVQVTFTPTATGSRTGTFTVNSSAGVFTTALTGTGETATQAVSLTPSAGSTLNFGNWETGQTSNPVYVYLTNVGTDPVTITTVPGGTGNFIVSNSIVVYDYSIGSDIYGCNYSDGQTLYPGGMCAVQVQFAPAANGSQTGTLTLTDSAGTQTLNLKGTGTAATPTTYFLPAATVFPETPVGGQTSSSYASYSEGDYSYFYYNGTGYLGIASAKVTTGTSSYFISPFNDNCTGDYISSGSFCSFQVTFAPTTAGYKPGTVTLTDTNGVTYALPLYGYAPTVVDGGYLNPASLAYVSQTLGTTSAYQTIYLGDTGSTNMTVGTVGGTDVGPGGEFVLSADGCSGTALTSFGGYCAINIEFSPLGNGARTGQLSVPVTYSDGTTATFTANLAGTGGADTSKAVLSPTASQLPDTAIGQPITSNYQTFTLYNVGTLPFVIDFLSGTNTVVGTSTTGDFYTSDTCSGTIVAPSKSCSVNVYFAPLPGAAGARSGSLTFPVTYSGATSITNFTATYTGNAVAANQSLVVTPSSAQLGTWTVGTYSASSAITLTNNGNVPVTLGVPTAAAPFSLSNSCGTKLAASATCSISVIFAPTTAAASTGTLTIPNSAPGNPTKIALSGTGIAASAELVFSTPAVTFGSELVGTGTETVQLLLVNQTSAYVPITSISVGGTNAADFSDTNNCAGTTLYPRSYCTINVTFAPLAGSLGTRKATIVESDGGTGGPRSATLTGTGINPTPTVGIFPGTLSFSKQNVGTTSSSLTFSVTNTGSASLKITTVASTGSSEFSITSNACNGKTITVGNDCLVRVAFDPTMGGTRTGQITITDNAANSPQTMALTGLGYGVPNAMLSTNSVTAPSVDTGQSSTTPAITLTDNGTDTLDISSVTITGTNASEFAVATNTCGTSLTAPSGSCMITVTFSPTAAGAQTATLNITDNSGNVAGSVQQVTLNGSGIGVPQASLGGTMLTFSSLDVGMTSASQSVTLSNAGTGALSISGIALGGTNPGDFALATPSGSCGSSLAAGASCTINATFSPKAAGTRTATITVTDNAGLVSGTTQTINLSGTGIGVPQASLNATTITFSSHAVGTSSTAHTVTLSNPGTASLSISSIALGGTDPGDFALVTPSGACGSSLTAGASCTINVTFTPQAAGTRTATITITDNAGLVSGTTQTISLSGTGTT